MSVHPPGPEYAIARALEAAADVHDDLGTVGFLWTNAVKVILSQPGTGRFYGKHRASAPGQPPAADTGAYRASWTSSVAGHVVSMYPQLPLPGYPAKLGQWLEFGTSKMAPRPHARPTSAATAPLMGPVFAKGITARQKASARG